MLLNDVQFVEAARALAERTMQAATMTTRSACGGASKNACRGRRPMKSSSVLAEMLAANVALPADEAAARAYLASGESLRDEQIPLARTCGVVASGGVDDESQ